MHIIVLMMVVAMAVNSAIMHLMQQDAFNCFYVLVYLISNN